MNYKKKRKIKRILFKTLISVVVLAGAFYLYAFVYRGHTELPAKNHMTNQSGFYTLKEQIHKLSKKEQLMEFAFKDKENEVEYGTYIIPGLWATRSLLTQKGDQPATCTSMTPQGLAVTDKYVLISAYCHSGKHNSVIYLIDKESHRFIKEVVLPGRPHVGGLAYDAEHEILWYSSNISGIAQAVSITMKDILQYDYENGYRPVEQHQVCSLYGIVRDSFMTFYKGCLYVGCFNKTTESVIARYAIDGEGRLVDKLDEELGMNFEMAVPLDYSTISQQAQGMAFYKDKLLLSHSFGILPSRVVFYEQSDKRLYVNENSAKSYRFPEKMEQIFVDGDNLYMLYESGAYAYRACSATIVDRVLKLDLTIMADYDKMESKG